MLARYTRFLPELFSIAAVFAAHYYLFVWLMRSERMRSLQGFRNRVKAFFSASTIFIWIGIVLQLPQVAHRLPYSPWQIWTRGLAIAYGISICLLFTIAVFGRMFRGA